MIITNLARQIVRILCNDMIAEEQRTEDLKEELLQRSVSPNEILKAKQLLYSMLTRHYSVLRRKKL